MKFTVKLELASHPCHFFSVLLYESVQACDMAQSWCSSKLRNNPTKKSMALEKMEQESNSTHKLKPQSKTSLGVHLHVKMTQNH